jgi:hypothetical protein
MHLSGRDLVLGGLLAIEEWFCDSQRLWAFFKPRGQQLLGIWSSFRRSKGIVHLIGLKGSRLGLATIAEIVGGARMVPPQTGGGQKRVTSRVLADTGTPAGQSSRLHSRCIRPLADAPVHESWQRQDLDKRVQDVQSVQAMDGLYSLDRIS